MGRLAHWVAFLGVSCLALCGGCSGNEKPSGLDEGDGLVLAETEGEGSRAGREGSPIGNVAWEAAETCAENAFRRVGEYLVVNNKHGGHRLVKGDSYEQCVGTTRGGFPVTWQWDIDTDQPYVKGFPQILYGVNPWTRVPSTDRLPIRIGDIRRLIVSHDVGLKAQGTHNLAFDLWITKDDTPAPDERTHEIMVWLAGNIPPGLAREREVTIAGDAYDFYRDELEPGVSYLMFVAHRPRTTGRTNLSAFLRFLVANDYLPSSAYLSTVELGTEMWDGQGSATVRGFSVTLNR